jgi:dipeptidyl aminopeptidase/acylaminoacyl peptidase
VKVENALMFAGALQKAGVPFDLHIYQQGRHGIGINDSRRSPIRTHGPATSCFG